MKNSDCLSFPFQLHRMLEEASLNGFDGIVCWHPSQNGFIIKKRQLFTSVIMPRYFAHTRWKSFQRQLNFYCFQRISPRGDSRGSCYIHPYLVRGNIESCRGIVRRSKKGTVAEVTSSVEDTKKVETPKPLDFLGVSNEQRISSPNNVRMQSLCEDLFALSSDSFDSLAVPQTSGEPVSSSMQPGLIRAPLHNIDASGGFQQNMDSVLDVVKQALESMDTSLPQSKSEPLQPNECPDLCKERYTNFKALENHFTSDLAEAIVLTFGGCGPDTQRDWTAQPQSV